jgi:hypothetical protein
MPFGEMGWIFRTFLTSSASVRNEHVFFKIFEVTFNRLPIQPANIRIQPSIWGV